MTLTHCNSVILTLKNYLSPNITSDQAVTKALKSLGVPFKPQILVLKLKLNSMVLVRKRTIPTERPQPAGEVSANF
jgi:hypothetical protein